MWYVGIPKTGPWETFRAERNPTFDTHGDEYAAVIGPFISGRGAKFMARYGRGNPHLLTVDDAERIAKHYATPGLHVGLDALRDLETLSGGKP